MLRHVLLSPEICLLRLMLEHPKVPRKAMASARHVLAFPGAPYLESSRRRWQAKACCTGAWWSVGPRGCLSGKENSRVLKGKGLLLVRGCSLLCRALHASFATSWWQKAAISTSHTKNHSVSLCLFLTATTADRFYRIDRAQVSMALSYAIVPPQHLLGRCLSVLRSHGLTGRLSLGDTKVSHHCPASPKGWCDWPSPGPAPAPPGSCGKGGSVGRSTETWVGSHLQDPRAERVRNSNVARLARHPLTGVVLPSIK